MNGTARILKWRITALPAVIAGLALLTACAGIPAPPARSASAFTQCMRIHGEPHWPAISPSGRYDESHIRINAPQHSRALAACSILLPLRAKIVETAAQRAATMVQLRKFARCMHAHGYARFPEPGPARAKGPITDSGTFRSKPFFLDTMRACGALRYHGGWWIPGT